MITLVGITGPARHGKDTVGAMLLKHMPHAKRFAYADKIKEFLKEAVEAPETMEENKEGEQEFTLYPMSILKALDTLGDIASKYPFKNLYRLFLGVIQANHALMYDLGSPRITFTSSWRKLFQLTGTEWGRQCIDRSVWISYLPEDNAVVTDVRAHGDSEEFKNIEAISILDKGGVMLRVIDPRKGEVIRSHSSEAGIDDEFITHTIINDGTLEDLERKVRDFTYTHLLSGEF